MWAGTYGKGIYLLNRNGGILEHLTTQSKDLTTNYTLAIYYDNDDNLWIGGLGGKLVVLNREKKTRKLYDIEWGE